MTSTNDDVMQDVPDYIQADWDRYRRIGQLINHWDRPGWTPGRRSYHWILRLNEAPLVRQLAAECQRHLSDLPTLDLVPLNSLHITLQRIAFTDQVSIKDVDAIADIARQHYATIPKPYVIIGPLAGSSGAVRFSAGPHPPIHHIRDIAKASIAAVRGTDAVPDRTTPFIPHMSIAYNNTPIDAHDIVQHVATLRRYQPVTTDVHSVDLVELHRRGKSYAWTLIASLPLDEIGN